MNSHQRKEAFFELQKGVSGNKDDEKIKYILNDGNNFYNSYRGDLCDILRGLQYYRKNLTNLDLLIQIKNVIIKFIKSLEDDLHDHIHNEKNNFKDMYAKSITLKNSKIIGSFKNKYVSK
ncbi:conserved Plasmodium protein, unknown function [Plasmodium sp. DRC-Itaito]|nr:conserved Plasmodium protein, unknown function [Plasmodium sp. DRC-Itaito]